MQLPMALPPGLESMRMPFMSAIGSPATITPIPAPTAAFVSSANAASTEGGRTRSQIVEQVRQTLASDIDAKVAERLESVWAQGEQAAQQFLTDSRSQRAEITRQMAEFREREASLAEENASLQHMLAAVLGQLAQWGSGGVPAALPPGLSANGAGFHQVAGTIKPEACLDGSSTSASGSTGSKSPNFSFDTEPVLGTSTPPGSGRSSTEGQVCDSSRNAAKLPDIPAFPFPQAPAAPFSLADALGFAEDVPTHQAFTPLPFPGATLSASAPVFAPFSTEYGSEAFSPFPFDYTAEADVGPADGFIFAIQLRKAEDCGFGLITSSIGYDGVLHIDCILPGGAAEAWNRQCGSSGAAEKVLLPGDCIVNVNGIAGNPEEMKVECDNKQLLRLTVVRSDGPRSAPPTHVAAVSERSVPFSPLRAEASSFVPFSPQAAEFIPLSLQSPEYVPMGMSDQYDSLGNSGC